MILEGLWLDFMWFVFFFDVVLYYFFQIIWKIGFEVFQFDVVDVQGILSIVEVYYFMEVYNEKVGLIFFGNDGD